MCAKLVMIVLLIFGTDAVLGRRIITDKNEDYEDIEAERPLGPSHIMPIVVRDTNPKANKISSKVVEEIIRELPTDDSFDRIGKMLNSSYEKMHRDVAEGNSAIKSRTTKTNSSEMRNSCIAISPFLFLLSKSFLFSI